VLSAGFGLLFILLTLVLSIISFYGVERAFRTKRTNKKQVLGWALLAGSVLSTSQVMAKVNAIFTPEQLPIEYRRGVDPAISCHGKIISDCLRGELSSDRELLVLGDSHGNQLNLFFDDLGKELGFKARVITGSSCVTIPGFDYQRIPEWAHAACLNQIEEGQVHQPNAEKIILVGSWSYHVQSEDFLEAFERYLQVTAAEAKPVIILSQIPRFTQSALRTQRFSTIGFESYLVLDQKYQTANRQLAIIAGRYEHVVYLALDSLPVFAEAPFYGGDLIYRDEHHINEVGAKAYAKYALPYFQQLLHER
jgi:hypothetical protein